MLRLGDEAARGVFARTALLSTASFRVHYAQPYNGQTKGREGQGFHRREQIMAGLPGWMTGNRLNKPERAPGRVIDAYPFGVASALDHMAQAVEICNGTPQDALGGLSPRAAHERLAGLTGFAPRRLRSEDFDRIVRREAVARVVDRGAVQIDGERMEGSALDRPVGLAAPALVPIRLNAGRAFVIADGIEHEVTPLSFAPFDRAGLVHRDSRAAAQAAELERRRALADTTANQFAAEYELAEKGPPLIGPPAEHALQPGAVARLIGAAMPDPAPSAQEAEFSQRLRNHRAARADAIRAGETFGA